LRARHARHSPIEAIEHHGHEDRHRSLLEAAFHRLDDGEEATEKRGGGEQIGQHVNASTPQLGVEQGLARLDFGHCSRLTGIRLRRGQLGRNSQGEGFRHEGF
jgi:hypothetical protein